MRAHERNYTGRIPDAQELYSGCVDSWRFCANAAQWAMRKSMPALAEHAVPAARVLRDLLVAQDRHHADVSVKAGLGKGYIRDIIMGKSQNPKSYDVARVFRELGVQFGTGLPEHSAPEAEKHGSDQPYTKQQVALVGLWGLLSPEGQALALAEIAKLITKYPR